MTADRSPPPVDGADLPETQRDRAFDGLLAASRVPVSEAERAELRRAYDAICDLAARVRRPGRQWTAKPFFAARKES